MSLVQPGIARERILAFGGAGTGKTDAYLSIAERYAQTGTPGKFHIIDTDYTAERSLESRPDAEKAIAKIWLCPEWADYERAIGTVKKIIKPQDWLVIDMVSPLWEMAQEYYVEKVFKKDLDDFWLTARTSAAKGSPLDGFKDWGVINKIYRQNVANEILRCGGHLFMTASATPLSSDLESKETKALYARFGVKPVGQKHNAHLVHTVLWTQAPKQGEWTLTTIKDRARQDLMGAKVTSFVDTYLQGVAGWKTDSGQQEIVA